MKATKARTMKRTTRGTSWDKMDMVEGKIIGTCWSSRSCADFGVSLDVPMERCRLKRPTYNWGAD